jgi:hypothetical protein
VWVESKTWWSSARIMWFQGGEVRITASVTAEDKKSEIKMVDGWIVDLEL